MKKLSNKELSLLVNYTSHEKDYPSKHYPFAVYNGTLDTSNLRPTISSDTLTGLDFDEKFNALYDCVQLMLVDGIIDRTEILFCQMEALKMGFKEAVIQFLTDERHSPKDYLKRMILERGYF